MEDFKNCKPVVSVDARLSVRQGRWSPRGIRSGCYWFPLYCARGVFRHRAVQSSRDVVPLGRPLGMSPIPEFPYGAPQVSILLRDLGGLAFCTGCYRSPDMVIIGP